MPDKTGLLSQLLRVGVGARLSEGPLLIKAGHITTRHVQVAIRYSGCHVLLVEWGSNTYWMCGWCKIARMEKPR